jgi:hypothetical protein
MARTSLTTWARTSQASWVGLILQQLRRPARHRRAVRAAHLGRRGRDGYGRGGPAARWRRSARGQCWKGLEGGRKAAVDDEVGAGYVAGALAGRQDDEIGDLGRRGEPACRGLLLLATDDVGGGDALGTTDSGGDTVVAEPKVSGHRAGTTATRASRAGVVVRAPATTDTPSARRALVMPVRCPCAHQSPASAYRSNTGPWPPPLTHRRPRSKRQPPSSSDEPRAHSAQVRPGRPTTDNVGDTFSAGSGWRFGAITGQSVWVSAQCGYQQAVRSRCDASDGRQRSG